MEENILKQTEDLIKLKSPDPSQLKGFINAEEAYQKLIDDGLAVKRGYNIMTTDEIYNPGLNSSYSQPSQRLHY